MSLWDLWREWAAGNSTLEFELWGLEMLWWGRIGKILQLLGALTVLAEIVGPERLESTAVALKEASPFTGMVDRARRRWRPVWDWVQTRRAGAAERSRTSAEAARSLGGVPFLALGVRLVVALLFVVVAVAFASWGWLIVLVALAGGLFLLLAAAVLSALGWLVAVTLIRPAALLISIAAVEAWVKVLAIALLVSGVHFDLLAT